MTNEIELCAELQGDITRLQKRVNVLEGTLEMVREVLHRSNRAAEAENDQSGPWLPAGLCDRIYSVLGGDHRGGRDECGHSRDHR